MLKSTCLHLKNILTPLSIRLIAKKSLNILFKFLLPVCILTLIKRSIKPLKNLFIGSMIFAAAPIVGLPIFWLSLLLKFANTCLANPGCWKHLFNTKKIWRKTRKKTSEDKKIKVSRIQDRCQNKDKNNGRNQLQHRENHHR